MREGDTRLRADTRTDEDVKFRTRGDGSVFKIVSHCSHLGRDSTTRAQDFQLVSSFAFRSRTLHNVVNEVAYYGTQLSVITTRSAVPLPAIDRNNQCKQLGGTLDTEAVISGSRPEG